MSKRGYEDENCAIARSLGILTDAWAMLIIRDAFLGTRRFRDFERRLKISKNVLTQRLQHLVDHGIMEKHEAGVHGKRQEYVLTSAGKDLTTLMTVLRQWGDRWIFGAGNEPILVVDRKTGKPIERVRLRREDGTPLPAKDMSLAPGPGASEETRAHFEKAAQEEA